MARRDARVHPESLLRVPLVAQMLRDPSVRLREVAVDNGWQYEKYLRLNTTGFNPLLRSVFYARRSALADWLRNPRASARSHNVRDLLVGEVFFAVHDYLHCWAYLAIQNLVPKLGFGTAAIREDNVEDFAFCHLLTETVATVGLDYWYLCAVDLDEVCNLGSRFKALTVSYDEKRIGEYRRFEPDFEVQSPAFFPRMAEFYCSGQFPHFDVEALRNSPVLLGWVEHELDYGAMQREYIRRWLSYLSGDVVRFPSERLRAPVDCSGRWKSRLVRDVGALLWDKVKGGRPSHFRPNVPRAAVWRRKDLSRKDFRFLSAEAFRGEDLSDAFGGEEGDDSFRHFFAQFASSHDSKAFDPSLARLFPEIVRLRDYKVAVALFRNQKRLPPARGGPVDLLTLN